MAEEIRFFVRVLLYTVLITAVYWLLTYEETGTVLFAGVIVAAGSFVVVALVTVPRTRRGRRSPAGLLGFADEGSLDLPMDAELTRFPVATAVPFLAALAATLVAVGAVYGPWLWIPGVALGVTTFGAWLGPGSERSSG